MSFAGAMLVAMAIDALLGWPDALFLRIGHPVTWLGRMIATADAWLNRGGEARRRLAGTLAALAVIVTAGGIGWVLQEALQRALTQHWAVTLIAGILAWPLVALRSMHGHVAAVAGPLLAGDLPAARAAVAMIVGRDARALDAPGVTRAATESLAENASDGIVAPLFWGALAGLPGIAAYKAINTLDSMIGHRTPRHEAFGWAAARIDDGANLIPARLTGLILALVSATPVAALTCMVRDARRHRSPNAGWPEAAMAGALGVRLSGPRVYGETVSPEPWVNAGAADPAPGDLMRALALYRRAMGVLAALLAGLAWAGW